MREGHPTTTPQQNNNVQSASANNPSMQQFDSSQNPGAQPSAPHDPQQMMGQPQQYMGQPPMMSMPGQPQQQSAGNGEYGGQGSQLNQRYKTQKCRHFESKGFCQWSENCQYAHGDHELRDMNDPIPDSVRSQASRRPVNNQNNRGNQGGMGGGPGQGQSQGYQGGGGPRGGYQSRGGGGYGGRGGGDSYHSSRGGHSSQGGYQQYGGAQGGNSFYQSGQGRGGRGGAQSQGRGGSGMGGGMYGEQDDFQNVRRQGRGGGRGGGFQGSSGHQSQGGGGPGFKNHKTVICKHYSAGRTCPYHNNCTYAHGVHELRQPINNGGPGQQMYQSKGQQQPYMGPQAIQMPAYPTGQPIYGGIIQQVGGMPGQIENPQIFGQAPTIIYGEPGGPHQRYDYNTGNQIPFDQQSQQQQMMVNNQGNPGMPQMYMAPGVQQPNGMMALQQPMVHPVPTQIVINSTTDGPDGQPMTTQRVLTVYILHNTQEVQEEIKMASQLSEQGNYDQALRMLSQLHEAQKIQMQETQQHSFGDPQDIAYVQQQPQNESKAASETAGQ